ncbi:hypothetical protein F511_17997 [Dorcoceras hygrometricum]|uniref:Uncharacterized protein n=1 Tax=Dorcoceras hygrometricum TaxID=472368 RepID=A0A2Z7CV60_9LAMI|nr:hypothetical protein F511_17997 [Dorcoceras hygrometricum]
MTFRVVRTNQYNQDIGLIHSTNGNHMESPNEGISIDHQVTIYLNAQNITMFPTNETWARQISQPANRFHLDSKSQSRRFPATNLCKALATRTKLKSTRNAHPKAQENRRSNLLIAPANHVHTGPSGFLNLLLLASKLVSMGRASLKESSATKNVKNRDWNRRKMAMENHGEQNISVDFTTSITAMSTVKAVKSAQFIPPATDFYLNRYNKARQFQPAPTSFHLDPSTTAEAILNLKSVKETHNQFISRSNLNFNT